jgi:DNA-binding PadR family transcriptional regulator
MPMRMMVLGLLLEKDRHPYEIRQTIKNRHWDQSFRLRDGSLYYAVDQMRNEGLIETAEIIATPGENRPDKTVYRITQAGREAFLNLFYEQLAQPAFPQHPLFLGLPFAHRADPKRVAGIAGIHLEACEGRITRVEEVLVRKGPQLPPGTAFLLRGIIAVSTAEREFLHELIEAAENGGLSFDPQAPQGG